MNEMNALMAIISFLATILMSVLGFIGVKIMNSIIELNKNVAIVITKVESHEKRITVLESPQCEHS